MDYYQIGQRIRTYRRACGLSQEQLAEKVDISVTHMSHIETGGTKLSLPVFVAIAQALNIRTDQLLYDVPPNAKAALSEEFASLLCQCDDAESHILFETLKAAKSAMDKYYRK